MSDKAGDRVGAILDGNTENVRFFGYGTYLGKILRPGWEQHANEFLPTAREVYQGQAELPAEEWVEQCDWPLGKCSDEELAYLTQQAYERAQERATWSDEQIIEDLKESNLSLLKNPCIELDTGGQVWGMECWWGSEAKIRAKIAAWEDAGASIEIVDMDEYRAKNPLA